MAIPTLLTMGKVHHTLVANEKRIRAGIILETAEAREVHHFCTLLGFGADAICPYLAMEAIFALQEDGKIAADQTRDQLVAKYINVRRLLPSSWVFLNAWIPLMCLRLQGSLCCF